MFVRFEDFNLAYADRGRGTPLLLIHGFPLNHSMWNQQLEALADRAHMVAPDLRGHGDSGSPPGVYTMERLAEDCKALLDALAITEPVVVCGHSMGGYVALAFQRLYPERLAGLILASTRASEDTPEGKAARDQTAEKAQAEGAAAIKQGMLSKLLAPQTYEDRPELVARVAELMSPTSVEGIAGAALGMKERPDARPGLPDVRVPALIVHGEDDQIIPLEAAEEMATAIPKARLEVIPRAGHMPNLEQPGAFNRAVNEFFEELA